MDFAQGVGRGYGQDYRGLLLREATTELGDVIAKSRKWFKRMFPGAVYNASKKIWVFETGETLWMNYARTMEDYEQYHGHEYPWIGWEELTNHAVGDVYLKIMSCNRSSNPIIPKKYRATCNPSGPGHAWVKRRFIDVCIPGRVYREEIEFEYPGKDGEIIKTKEKVERTHIRSFSAENSQLMTADPGYLANIHQMCEGNEMLRKAWLMGSWNITIGGFFTDVWDPKIHVIDPFLIPKSWNCYRSFDWGSSRPWAVTYGVECNGEQPLNYNPDRKIPYLPKVSIIIPNELYGWNGTHNEGDKATSHEIADRVKGKDAAIHLEYGLEVYPGPADTSIWEVRDGQSIADNMRSGGVNWLRAYKGSGSRIAGWAIIRQMLNAAKNGSLESPHLYFFSSAHHHIRTLPEMQRDKKNPEDIDTDGEDHAMDSIRYLLSRKMFKMERKGVRM
jgi:hypothetical protein